MDFTALPNLHPAFVHFPIALVPLALLFEFIGVLLRKQDWLERAAVAIWVLAGVSSYVAYETGEEAADGLVGVPANLEPLIGVHSDWGHRVFYGLAAFALVRLAAWFWVPETRRVLVCWLLLAPEIALFLVVVQTAELGGELVYRHGVAVHKTPQEGPPATNASDESPPAGATTRTTTAEDGTESGAGPESRLTTTQDGTVVWRPAPGDGDALGSVVTALGEMSLNGVSSRGGNPEGLLLQASGESWLALPGTFSDVRVEAEIEIVNFQGEIGLFHHAQHPDAAGLLVQSTDGTQTLWEIRGEPRNLNDADHQPSGTFVLAISAAGKHLKGLVDGATVTHGHIEPGPDGRAGLLLRGEGTVRLVRLSAQPL